MEAMQQPDTMPRTDLTLRAKMLPGFGIVLVTAMVLTNWVMLFGVPYTSYSGLLQEKRIEEIRKLSLIADLKKKDFLVHLD